LSSVMKTLSIVCGRTVVNKLHGPHAQGEKLPATGGKQQQKFEGMSESICPVRPGGIERKPERSTDMAQAPAQPEFPPMPKALGGLTPHLSIEGAAKAAAFYEKAFGAEQVFAVPPDEQGRTMHIHLYLNGSSLMLSDFFPEHDHAAKPVQACTMQLHRSEERRVGKECRSRWSPDH